MTATPLDLLSPSRKLLIVEIKERGEATAEQLASATYLSVAAVRMHLSAMERLGLVAHISRRHGPGRPLHVYRLAPAGEELFPQGYSELLWQLLEAISISPECSDRVWGVVETQQVNALRRSLRSESPQARIRELFAAPEVSVFQPELEEDDHAWRVRMHHCPIIEAALCDPRVCESKRRIFRRVLGPGVELTQETTRSADNHQCSFLVRIQEDD